MSAISFSIMSDDFHNDCKFKFILEKYLQLITEIISVKSSHY